MFSTIFGSLLLVSSMAAGVSSKPIPKNRLDMSRRTDFSFNNWHGISSLNHFDDFYGSGNFDGSLHRSETIVHEKQLVCHTQQIEIIQQRLLVLQEMAKRIVTETVCEVETQVVVFEQHHASLGNFGHDLRRISGHRVGFDVGIANHASNFFHADGSLNFDDWGFSGHDLGSQTVVVGGSNWNDHTSPISVGSAYNTAHDAYVSLHPEISSSISPNVIDPSVVSPDIVPSDAGVPPVPAPSDVTPVTPVSDPALAPASTDAVAPSVSPSAPAAPTASA